MKRHSSLLAVGLLIFVVLACNLSKNRNGNNSNNSNNSNSNSNRNSNSSTNTNRPANADVFVEKLVMAKDNNGKPGEETTTFASSDRTIHCIADLNKAKNGTNVKFVWKAIDVEGSKNEEIKTIEYTTKSFENKVHGHLTLPYDWPKGNYRVEIFINGSLDKTIDYTIG